MDESDGERTEAEEAARRAREYAAMYDDYREEENDGEPVHRAVFQDTMADLLTDPFLYPAFLPALFGSPPGVWHDLDDLCDGQAGARERLRVVTRFLLEAGSPADSATMCVQWTTHPRDDDYAVVLFITTWDFCVQVANQWKERTSSP